MRVLCIIDVILWTIAFLKMTQEVLVRGPSVGYLVIIITLCWPAYCTFAAWAAAIRSVATKLRRPALCAFVYLFIYSYEFYFPWLRTCRWEWSRRFKCRCLSVRTRCWYNISWVFILVSVSAIALFFEHLFNAVVLRLPKHTRKLNITVLTCTYCSMQCCRNTTRQNEYEVG